MPFVGPTFSITTNEFYPAVDGVVLDADAWNAVAEDLANGLTAVVTRDGAGSMSGALNMGSHKVTNLLAATNPSDAARYDQVTPVDPTLIAWGNLAFTATDNLGYATGIDTFALLATKAAGRSVLTLDDPNADRIVFFDDSEGTAAYLTVGTGLAISTTTIAVSANLQLYNAITPSANVQSFLGAADYAAMRTQLSLGALATITPGTGVATALAVNVGSAGAIVVNGGALGTPSSGTLSSCTGLPVSTGISGLGTGVATFLATPSSANLAAAVTDETGSGALVFGTSPTIASPTLSGTVAGSVTFSGNSTFSGGAVTFSNLATSMPAAGSGGTLKLSNGDTNYGILFAVSNATGTGYVQAQRTDASATVYPLSLNPNGGDIIGNSTGPTSVYSLGYRGAPNVGSPNSAYTMVLADAGGTLYHDEVTARTWTIPANASVAFPIGTVIILDNTGNSGAAGSITLSITSDTLQRGDGVSGTGSRTIAASAVAAIRKVASTVWVITGTFT